jgi:hypothetical protein
MHLRQFLLLGLLAGCLTSCMTPTQESEYRWKQFNPYYQPAHDFDRETRF